MMTTPLRHILSFENGNGPGQRRRDLIDKLFLYGNYLANVLSQQWIEAVAKKYGALALPLYITTVSPDWNKVQERYGERTFQKLVVFRVSLDRVNHSNIVVGNLDNGEFYQYEPHGAGTGLASGEHAFKYAQDCGDVARYVQDLGSKVLKRPVTFQGPSVCVLRGLQGQQCRQLWRVCAGQDVDTGLCTLTSLLFLERMLKGYNMSATFAAAASEYAGRTVPTTFKNKVVNAQTMRVNANAESQQTAVMMALLKFVRELIKMASKDGKIPSDAQLRERYKTWYGGAFTEGPVIIPDANKLRLAPGYKDLDLPTQPNRLIGSTVQKFMKDRVQTLDGQAPRMFVIDLGTARAPHLRDMRVLVKCGLPTLNEVPPRACLTVACAALDILPVPGSLSEPARLSQVSDERFLALTDIGKAYTNLVSDVSGSASVHYIGARHRVRSMFAVPLLIPLLVATTVVPRDNEVFTWFDKKVFTLPGDEVVQYISMLACQAWSFVFVLEELDSRLPPNLPKEMRLSAGTRNKLLKAYATDQRTYPGVYIMAKAPKFRAVAKREPTAVLLKYEEVMSKMLLRVLHTRVKGIGYEALRGVLLDSSLVCKKPFINR